MIARQGRQRARARLPARAARGDRRLRRLHRPHRRARPRAPAPTSCSTCRGRGKVAAQNAAVERARGELLAFCDANAHLGARRAARAGRAVRATRRSATSAARRGLLDQGGSNQEGAYWRYELAVRDARVARSAGSPPATARSTRSARAAYLPLGPAAQPRPLVPVHAHQARAGAPSTRRRRSPRRRWWRRIEGEFARKRRMMRGIFDEVVRDGMLSPRGYGPIYAFEIASHRGLRYASPLLHLVALARQPRAARRRARSTRSRSRSQLRCCSRPRSPGAVAAARRCGSPATTCSMTASIAAGPLGPDPPRHPGRLGEGGGDAVSGEALDLADRRASRWSSPCAAAASLIAAIAIKLDSRGPVLYRARRVGRDGERVRAAQAAHDAHRQRPGRGRHPGARRRPAGDPGRRASCAASRSTSCRT